MISTLCLHTYGAYGACVQPAGHTDSHADAFGYPIPATDLSRATWGDVYAHLRYQHHLSADHAETVLSIAAEGNGVIVAGTDILVKAHTNGPDPTNLWYAILPAPSPKIGA